MKRLFLVIVAMLSMCATFAENESVNYVENVETYDMSLNYRRLGECLGLTLEQMESVEHIHGTFCGEMMFASKLNSEERDELVRLAVLKDLKYMSYILDAKQYRGYALLLNTTLNNRGIEVAKE